MIIIIFIIERVNTSFVIGTSSEAKDVLNLTL